MRGRFSVVCSGWQPQQHFESDIDVSPWWNVFELVRVRAFSLPELQRLLEQLDLALGDDDVLAAYHLTGGHPWVVGFLLQAIRSGETIQKLRDDALRLGFEWTLQSRVAYQTAQRVLGSTFSLTMRSLARRELIPSRKIREVLCLCGIARDVDEDPMVCSEVFHRFAEMEDSSPAIDG